MTTKEVSVFFRTAQARRTAALEDVTRVARMLVPLLKDRQMLETAKDLESKLFMLDAVNQEVTDFIKADPEGVIRMITQGASDHE
jgi:hypothetical protein